MFQVGDKVIVSGLGGKVVDVDTTFATPLYTVLFSQPVVRVLQEAQMPAAPTPGAATTSPAS